VVLAERSSWPAVDAVGDSFQLACGDTRRLSTTVGGACPDARQRN